MGAAYPVPTPTSPRRLRRSLLVTVCRNLLMPRAPDCHRSLAAPGLTAGEEREVAERRRKLVLYALRSPFLEATTL